VAIEGHFSRREDIRPSGPVLACIRAESISRVSDSQTGANVFDARVVSLGFLGPLVTCTLQVGEVTLRAELPARKPPAIDETIKVRIEPDEVIIISER
jgi:ABC-type Fe3+/spermidine/putrescine transport system ATPase subunit